MKSATVEQMRRCDAYTIDHFVPSMELIRRAAFSVFCEVEWVGKIAIVVGSGNNGADGFALACILKEHDRDCTIYTVSSRLHSECAVWAERAKALGCEILSYECGCLKEVDIIVDCMLGTGFSGTPRETYREAILEINATDAYVVSVDINSGMNGDDGAGETVVCSDLTVTVEFVKCGQLMPTACDYMKRLVCVSIGIAELEGLRAIPEDGVVPWLDMQLRKYV